MYSDNQIRTILDTYVAHLRDLEGVFAEEHEGRAQLDYPRAAKVQVRPPQSMSDSVWHVRQVAEATRGYAAVTNWLTLHMTPAHAQDFGNRMSSLMELAAAADNADKAESPDRCAACIAVRLEMEVLLDYLSGLSQKVKAVMDSHKGGDTPDDTSNNSAVLPDTSPIHLRNLEQRIREYEQSRRQRRDDAIMQKAASVTLKDKVLRDKCKGSKTWQKRRDLLKVMSDSDIESGEFREALSELNRQRSDGKRVNAKLCSMMMSNMNEAEKRLLRENQAVSKVSKVSTAWPVYIEWVQDRFAAELDDCQEGKSIEDVLAKIHKDDKYGTGQLLAALWEKCRDECEEMGLPKPEDSGDRYDGEDDGDLVLHKDSPAILHALANSRVTMVQANIEVAAELSHATVVKRLGELRTAGFVHRPKGERGGEAITEAGRKVLAAASPNTK